MRTRRLGLSGHSRAAVFRRATIIGFISFLTLIDLFGSQALLPQLAAHYRTDATTMGFAVNGATIGMAASGLTMAYFADRIDCRLGIWISLALLSIPTSLLAFAGDVNAFLALRILQGVFMASAFTLTMSYLSEQCDVTAASGAMAAYITGNVASNLLGRLMATSLADWLSVSDSFLVFAGLNLVGALLAVTFIGARTVVPQYTRAAGAKRSPLLVWRDHLAVPALLATFVIGFLLLFVFVGTFTYINLELVGPRYNVPASKLGLIYLVFVPALLTTPLASAATQRIGVPLAFACAILVTCAGLAMTLHEELLVLVTGLAAIGAGTFFAQAIATAYVGRTAHHNHAAANGLYLTFYYTGGLTGALVVGHMIKWGGWHGTVPLLIAAMGLAGLLGVSLPNRKRSPQFVRS